MSSSDRPAGAYRIAVIAGDGVGKEVVPAGISVLEAAAGQHDVDLSLEHLPWGSDYYRETGAMMPPDGIEILREFDAVYVGAVGSPEVPDDVTLWGLLLPIRQRFDQFVNLRPVKLMAGVPCPLRLSQGATIDMMCVRENTEGEYAGIGGRAHEGFGHEVGIQTDVFTRVGVERIVRYAFDLAKKRRGKVTSITKSNAGRHAFVFWDDVAEQVAADYPEIEFERVLVDAAAAYFVTRPESFDVVVGSNLFIDVLSDIGAVIQGGMGFAASANIGSDRGVPGMFEPVHGSAPDIAGRKIANPIGAIWAGAMMFEHLGEAAAAASIMQAVETVLERGEARSPDLGGESGTDEVAAAVVAHLGTA